MFILGLILTIKPDPCSIFLYVILLLELEKRLLDKIAHNMYKNSHKRNITNIVLIVGRSLFLLQSEPLV